MDNFLKKSYIVLVLLSMLSACGGGGGSSIPTVKATDNGYYDFTLLFKITNAGTGEVKITPSDTICQSKCTDKFPSGTIIKLIETAGLGSSFKGFSGDQGCSAGEINLKSNTTCIALFDPIPGFSAYNLAIKPAGSGIGIVNSVPPGIECGTVCNQDFAANLPITLTAKASEGNAFAGWGGTGCPTGTTKTVTVKMTSGPLECTATFEPSTTDVKLTVSLAGGGSGSVSSSIPTGSVCTTTPCETLYVLDSVVVLTAKPATDNIFVGWSGDCAGASNNPVTTVTMNSVKACTATFDVKPAVLVYNLVVNPAGTGTGRVTSIPPGIDCGTACNKDFATGTAVTLTATPANATSVFSVWGGACSGGGTTTSTTVTMDAAKACTATFDPTAAVKHNLTIVKAGLGQGVVTSITPTGINCGATCTAAYAANSVVTLSATASDGSKFDGWTGTGCGRTVTMTAAKTCTATFSIAPTTTFPLTVSSSALGITTVNWDLNPLKAADCGANCFTYAAGTLVTLTMVSNPGFIFTGWTGTGCTTTATTVTFTMNAATTCQMNFTAAPTTTFPLTVSSSALGITTVNWDLNPLKAADCGANCFTYAAGTLVTLTMVSNPGFIFTGWTGTGCTTTAAAVTVKMNSAITCQMNFR